MNQAVHIVLWLFVGAIVVLIVTHASGFATAVTSVGNLADNSAKILAGQG